MGLALEMSKVFVDGNFETKLYTYLKPNRK